MKFRSNVSLLAIFSLITVFSLTAMGDNHAFATTPVVATAAITAPNQITIVYNTPVNTLPGDYTSLGGGLAGSTVTSVVSNTGNTVVLQFSPSTANTAATGTVNIGAGVTSQDTSTPITPIVGQALTDGQKPTLTTVNIVSNNGLNTAFAKTGNTITLHFIASEKMNAGSVTAHINGVPEAVTDNNPGTDTDFTATYSVTGAESNGVVTFSITGADTSANVMNPNPRTTTTDSSSVTFDNTTPSISTVHITSNNANTAFAKSGNTITLTFVSSEYITTPTITFTPSLTPATSITSTGNDHIHWTATYLVTGAETDGLTTFSVNTYTSQAGTSPAGATTATTDASSVTLENAVTLSTRHIASNNGLSSTLAKSGDTVTLTLTSTQAINLPTVTINSVSRTPVDNNPGTDTSFTVTYTTTGSETDDLTVPFSVSFTDKAGTAHGPVTTTSDASAVTFETAFPAVTPVTIASSNANPAYAKSGNTITVTFTSAENIQAPTATITDSGSNVHAATITGGPTVWHAAYTLGGAEPNGPVTFSINGLADPAGNTHASITSTTDSSKVTIENTAPAITPVSIASNNADTTKAGVGTTVTVSFTSATPILSPVGATIDGVVVTTITNPGNDAMHWTVSRAMTGSDANGAVVFSIPITDIVGNVGSAVTLTTDASAVQFSKTLPTVTSAKITDSTHVTVVYSEAVNTVTGDYTSLSINSLSNTVTGISGSGTTTVVLTLGTTVTNTAATGTMNIGTGVTDLFGNHLVAVTGQSITDGQPPVLTTVSIASTNSINNQFARPGDTVTLTFTASETIVPTTVRIDSVTVTAQSLGSNNWRASHVMTGSDTTGVIPISIAFRDTATPANTGTTVTSVTDSSSVTFFNAAPTVVTTPGSTAVTGPNQITVTYNQPVLTTASDYSNLIVNGIGPRGIISVTGSGTTTIAIAFNGASVPTSAIGSVNIGATVTNQAGIALAPVTGQALTDGQSPQVVSATLTDTTHVTIVYSEPVNTIAGDYTSLRFTPGGANTVSSISGSGTATIVLTLGTSVTNTGATGTVRIASTVTDTSPAANALVPVTQNIASQAGLSLVSAAVTSPTTVTLVWSTTVTTTASDYSNLVIDSQARTISGITGSGTNTIVVTYSGGSFVGTGLTGTNTIDIGTGVTGSNSVHFAGVTGQVLADGMAPTLSPVSIISNNVINTALARVGDVVTLSFTASEPINTPTVTISSPGHSVTAVTQSSDNIHWTASRTIASGDNNGIMTFRIVFSDTSSNAGTPVTAVTDSSSVTVDKTAPTVTSSIITGPNQVTLTYSEPVLTTLGDYANLAITGIPTPVLTGISGSGSSTIVLTFSGGSASNSATGSIDIATSVTNAAGVPFAGVTGLTLANNQAPTVVSAKITGPNTITIVYDRTVNTSAPDYTLTSVSSVSRNILTVSGTGSTTITLTFDGAAAVTSATGSVHIGTGVTDTSGNHFVAKTQVLADGQSPQIVSATITDNTHVTLVYSEPVNTVAGDYTAVSFNSLANTVSSISGSGTATIVLTLGTPVTNTGATGTVNIASTVTDLPGNAFVPVTQPIADGQPPALVSSLITDPTHLTLTYSEPVTTVSGDYTITSIDGTARSVTSISGSGTSTIVLGFDGAVATSSSTGTINIGTGPVDGQGMHFAGVTGAALTPLVLPTITSSAITGPNQITIVWDKPVITNTIDYTNLNINGGVGHRNVISLSGSGTATTILTFDGPALTNTAATGTVNIATTVVDLVGDHFAGVTGRALTDGQNPLLVSAGVTSSTHVTLVYSETVSTATGDYSGLVIDGVARTISSVTTGSSTIVITFSGGPAITASSSGTINIGNTVVDTSGNPFAGVSGQAVLDQQKPTVTSQKITGPNTITLVFSEPVVTTASDYSALSITGISTPTISSVLGSGSSTITITFAGGTAGTGATGSITIGSTLTDLAGNTITPVTKALRDGQPPVLTSVSIASDNANTALAIPGNTVTVTFTASETLGGTPVVSIDGVAATTVTNTVGNTWTASRIMTSTDPGNTPVSFTINFRDTATPANIGTQVTAVTDSSIVTLQNALPGLVSTKITGPNTITIVYTQPVTTTASDYTGLAITGIATPTVSSISGSGTSTIAITFAGGTASTSATGTINIGTGVHDASNNNPFGGVTGRVLADGQAPQVTSAKIIDSTHVQIVYTEPVTTVTGDYTNFQVTGGPFIAINVISGSGTNTITATLASAVPSTASTGTISIASTVADLVGNTFAGVTSQAVGDGQPPIITSSSLTGTNQFTIVYSEPVNTVAGDYTNLVLSSSGSRNVLSITGSGTNTITGTFDGAAALSTETGTVSVGTGVVDLSGNAFLGQAFQHLTNPQLPPGQVTALSTHTLSTSSVSLSWTAPINPGSTPITGYKIERATGIIFTTIVANTGSTATTFTDTGLSAATGYTYRVSAINTQGPGTASSTSSATTLANGQYITDLMTVYGARSDLQSAFPEVAQGNLNNLFAWASVHGVLEASQLQKHAAVYDALYVWTLRPDLQSAFPEAASGATLTNLLSWAGVHGITEMPTILASHTALYHLMFAYSIRPDVAAAFPEAANGDNTGNLFTWAANHGIIEMPTILGSASDVAIYKLMYVDTIRSDLQAAFPEATNSGNLTNLFAWANVHGFIEESAILGANTGQYVHAPPFP